MCSDVICFAPIVNTPPTIIPVMPDDFCADSGPYDLTAFQIDLGGGIGTFVWFNADPAAGGMMIDGSAVVQGNATTVTYWLELTDDATGCSSVGNIDITILAAEAVVVEEATICEGDSYTASSGTVFTMSGMEVLTNVAGCEFTLMVNLTFNTPIDETETAIV